MMAGTERAAIVPPSWATISVITPEGGAGTIWVVFAPARSPML
jgi:hypothetical protein